MTNAVQEVVTPQNAALVEEKKLLAALCYGESSSANEYEEMAAIANVFVRQAAARRKNVSELIKSDPSYSFVVSDGNQRYNALLKASEKEIKNNKGMSVAVSAAENALDPAGRDYSNGAYFWDGADLKSNYKNHSKVRQGIKFSDPSHNIYSVQESTREVVVYWQVKNKKGKIVKSKERGRYSYVYISTAAYGGTVFWKYSGDFLTVTGSKEYK